MNQTSTWINIKYNKMEKGKVGFDSCKLIDMKNALYLFLFFLIDVMEINNPQFTRKY